MPEIKSNHASKRDRTLTYMKSLIGTRAWAHHMCFDKFLLAFESRDLSQADKSIIRVSSFSKLSEGSRTYFSVSQQLRPELSEK